MSSQLPAWSWIAITLFAVTMQSVRTAGQKQLTAHLDSFSVTLVRFLFGLPFALAYLLAVKTAFALTLPAIPDEFLVYACVASIGQIVATVLLIYLFSLRNFAVGSTYARTEAFLTAAIGAVFFDELISAGGWLAITVSVAGVVVLTVARSDPLTQQHWYQRLWNKTAVVGLGSGLGFAMASLCLREASLSFGLDNSLYTAGLTLVTMVVLQTVIMLVFVANRNAAQLKVVCVHWKLCTFVGLTSALGSVGWFVAMTLERASYVKALGQIEFLLALGISSAFFRERSSRLELAGMGLVAGGVLILIAFG